MRGPTVMTIIAANPTVGACLDPPQIPPCTSVHAAQKPSIADTMDHLWQSAETQGSSDAGLQQGLLQVDAAFSHAICQGSRRSWMPGGPSAGSFPHCARIL